MLHVAYHTATTLTKKSHAIEMMVVLLSLLLASLLPCSSLAFVLPSPSSSIRQPSSDTFLSMLPDENVNRRGLLLRTGIFVVASKLGFNGAKPAEAVPEQKVYSSNARNMMRLGEGDSSGGSGELLLSN